MRYPGLCLLVVLMLVGGVSSATTVFPEKQWADQDPTDAGWSSAKLENAKKLAAEFGSTGVLVVQDGRVIAAWGNVAEKVTVASIRKSFLSALYGIAIADGRIESSKTLEALGIDDKPPSLTPVEKTATIRDLLMARSGIYHYAASEPQSMKDRRPERGAHAPGTHWYYNNWDFNALGTIYRRLAKEDIFDAIERRIAKPIGMEDYSAADGKYVTSGVSEHPAYHMRFSTRDLARFGWLFLNGGRWNGVQVVPEAWVKESTAPLSEVSSGLGYGLMWWASIKDVQLGAKVGGGAYSARGYGGQYLFVLPAYGMVIAHLHAKQIQSPRVGELLRLIVAAAPPPER